MRGFLIRYQTVVLMAILAISGCGHGKVVPKWEGKLWAGDSEKAGITRLQEQRTIPASDPEFDEYVAMTYGDLRSLFAIIQSCKQWPKGMKMMSAQEALLRMQVLMTDLEREALEESKR